MKTLQEIVTDLEQSGQTESAAFSELKELAQREAATIAATSWLELPDNEIAKGVRIAIEQLKVQSVSKFEGIASMAACHTLVSMAIKTNSEIITHSFDGYSQAGQPKGDWEVIVRQKES